MKGFLRGSTLAISARGARLPEPPSREEAVEGTPGRSFLEVDLATPDRRVPPTSWLVEEATSLAVVVAFFLVFREFGVS